MGKDRLIKTNITFFFLVFFLFSCGEKTYFNSKDLVWTKLYKVGDTLIFKNKIKNKKRIIILNVKKYHTKYEPMISQWQSERVQIFYKIEGDNSEHSFLMLTKVNEPFLKLNLFNTNFQVNQKLKFDTVSLKLTNKEFNKAYKFKSFYSLDNSSPHTLFWDEKYGIIKYITYGDNVWERINF